MKRNSKWVTAALFAVLLAVSAYTQQARLKPVVPEGSIPGRYIRITYHLFESGTYSDAPIRKRTPRPEAVREPMLPTVLVGLMYVDSEFAAKATGCVGHPKDESCIRAYRNVPRLNLALYLGGALLVGMTLLRLGVGRLWAGAGLLLVGTNASAARGIGQILLEPLSLFLISAASYCLLCCAQERTSSRAVACGVVLGLLALTKAQYLQLIGPALGAMLVLDLLVSGKRSGKRELRGAVARTVLCGLVVAAVAGPYMLRNQHHFGGAFIVKPRRALPVLSARAHYNQMTSEEFRAAFVYWGFDGPRRAEDELPLESYTRLDRSNQDGYHARSVVAYRERLEAALDGGAERIEAAASLRSSYLREFLGEPLQHLRVTIAVTYRLLHGDSHWMITFPASLLALVLMFHGRRWEALLALLPGLYTVAFLGLLSHGKHRYGIPAVPALAVGTVLSLQWLSARVRDTLRERRSSR